MNTSGLELAEGAESARKLLPSARCCSGVGLGDGCGEAIGEAAIGCSVRRTTVAAGASEGAGAKRDGVGAEEDPEED